MTGRDETRAKVATMRAAARRLPDRLPATFEVPPVRLKTVNGFDAAVFPYTTDIPFLPRWGEPLLFGPGSIHVAHTADEYVDVDELRQSVDTYERLAKTLLAR